VNETRASSAEELIDHIVPEGFDWEELVRTYPIPTLLLAAAGGFVLGRSRGAAILGALAAFAAGKVGEHVNELLGDEIL